MKQRKRRIALLGPANTVHYQRWAAALTERGHDVCVISQHRCDPAVLPRAATVVWLPHQGQAGYFLNATHLRQAVQRWRPDVLNAHYASGYGTTAALSKQNSVLLSVWGSDVFDFPQEGFLKRWLVRRNLRCATLIASTSHVMANRVRSLTPERNEIAITPFGVDMARFAPRRDSQSPEVLTLGIVKTLADKYGVDLLLQAFAGLVDDPEVRSAASCRLLIVGDGPRREQLVTLATALGIERCTQFVGAVPHSDVPRWLEQMDIFIAPSRLDSESFGVAVIEASASGLPVVVSDVGGLPEVVRHDETGLIVPREDVSALTGALKRLVLDRGLRDQLGRQGRDHVATEFEWGHCVDLMERAYERTMTLARQ